MRVKLLLLLVAIVITGAFTSNPVRGQNQAAPRAIAAWAAGSMEVRVRFDRAIDPSLGKSVEGRTIEFDTARKTVQAGLARSAANGHPSDTQGTLRIAAASLIDGGRTLVLTTDPHPRAAVYSLDLPTGKVEYDLTGVEVSWTPQGDDAKPAWTTRWPGLEIRAAKKSGDAMLADLDKPGRLTLDTLITPPKGQVTIALSGHAFEATLAGEEAASKSEGNPFTAIFAIESTGDPLPLSVTVPTGKLRDDPGIRLTMNQAGGPTTAISLDRLSLPWTPLEPPTPADLPNIPELKGGDRVKGRAVFYGAEAKCSSCHKVRGEGGEVGPDLSDLVGRDLKDVYRNIAEPSVRIHPAYVSYTVALKDGRILVGTVRAEGASSLKVTDTEAKATVVPRAEMEEMRPSATSIMPVGLAGAIGEQRLRDLIAFLTAPVSP